MGTKLQPQNMGGKISIFGPCHRVVKNKKCRRVSKMGKIVPPLLLME